jgi:hypothetical protein
MFTGSIELVSDTQIFARVREGRQLLVYEMKYASRNELAMVLPIPVAAGTPEEGVRFVNLENCKGFFKELAAGFPRPKHDEGMMLGASLDLVDHATILKVHDVGSFEASFVPTPADFGRLDERFRLPPEIWLELNTYRDYGFAVFKLKPTEAANAHPMAFEFPTRDAKRIFFPTVHVHDRRVKRTAHFDHMLYCQPTHAMNWHLQGWTPSTYPASMFVKCEAVRALVDLVLPFWRIGLHGELANVDTWLGEGGTIPEKADAVRV